MKKNLQIAVSVLLLSLAFIIITISWTRASVSLIWQGQRPSPGLVLPGSPRSLSFNPADWQLPYPGILPGSWLYPLKKARLRLWLFLAKSSDQHLAIFLAESKKDLSATLLLLRADKPLIARQSWENAAGLLAGASQYISKSSNPAQFSFEIKDLSQKLLIIQTDNQLAVDPLLLGKITSFSALP